MRVSEPNSDAPIVLILTCRISPGQRVKSALAEAARLFPGLTVEIVDGLVENDLEVDALFHPVAASWLSKRPPTRREVAVYGTHRLAWQTLLERGHRSAIILEDDFYATDPCLMGELVQTMPSVLASGLHILKLYDYPRVRNGGWALERYVGKLRLVQWARPRAGLVGYVLTAEGARRFLCRPRIFRVVDEDIKYFWELGLDIWSLRPNPVIDASYNLGGSLLEEVRLRSRSRRKFVRSFLGIVLSFHRRIRNRLAFLRSCIIHRDARIRRFNNETLTIAEQRQFERLENSFSATNISPDDGHS